MNKYNIFFLLSFFVCNFVIFADNEYLFEDNEFVFKAYYDDTINPGFKFSFNDQKFTMEIPELDSMEIERGKYIKESIESEYTIETVDNFHFLVIDRHKYLILYYQDLICVLVDLDNNHSFFGLNIQSEYVQTSDIIRRNQIGFLGSQNDYTMYSSYLEEVVKGNHFIYNGIGTYYYQITTPWVEGVSGNGIGEWIQEKIFFETNQIVLFNGYIDPRRPDLYYKNSRVKEIEVVSSNNHWNFFLEDSINPQIVELPINITGDVKLIIKDIYPGSKYEDACLAGIYYLYSYDR